MIHKILAGMAVAAVLAVGLSGMPANVFAVVPPGPPSSTPVGTAVACSTVQAVLTNNAIPPTTISQILAELGC